MSRYSPTVTPVAGPSLADALLQGVDLVHSIQDRRRARKSADELAEQRRRQADDAHLLSKAQLYNLGVREESEFDVAPDAMARGLLGEPDPTPNFTTTPQDWSRALTGRQPRPSPLDPQPSALGAPAPAPTGLRGMAFDPATGTFGGRPPNPAAVMLGQAAKVRIGSNLVIDPNQTPEARQARARQEQAEQGERMRVDRERQSAVEARRADHAALQIANPAHVAPFNENVNYAPLLAHALKLEEGKATAAGRPGNEPSIAELKQARIRELVAGGMALDKASAQTRLEFGEAPPSANVPVVQVQDADGNVRYVAQSDAVGQQAPQRAAMGSAALKKALASNTSQSSVIEDAIAELEKYPAAVGAKRGLGDFIPFAGNIADKVNQTLDPKGVDARASLANISSLVIHDRSGAVVTASESPRLAPFVPRTTDNAETAIKKLKKLARAIQTESDALEEQLGVGGPVVPSGAVPPEGDSSADAAPATPPNPLLARKQALWDASVEKHGITVTKRELGERPK